MTDSEHIERTCPHCGQSHPERMNFCPITGKKIAPIQDKCPGCGKSIQRIWSHCPSCGYALNNESAETIIAFPHETYPEGATRPSPVNWKVWIGILVILLLFVVGGYFIWHYLDDLKSVTADVSSLFSAEFTPTNEALRKPDRATDHLDSEAQNDTSEEETPLPSSTIFLPTDTPTTSFTPITSPSLTPTPSPTPTITPPPTKPLAFDWNSEIIQRSQDVGYFTTMIIDSNGNDHISYFQDNSDMAWYAHNDTGDWRFDYVAGGVGSGFNLSLDMDSRGLPHLAFRVKGRNVAPEVKYVYWTGKAWTLIRVFGSFAADTDISLALDPDDNPHISYQDAQSYDLMYAHYSSQKGWEIQPIDDASQTCQSLPIAVDTDGNPHFVYQSPDEGLKYAVIREAGLYRANVDEDPGTGYFSALTLDSNDLPHVAYYDLDQKALKYAFLLDDVWQITTVDDSEDVGTYPSIAISPSGEVHISYYNNTSTALKYAHGRDGQWDIYVVDDTGDVGLFNSLALDPNGIPHISYLDANNEDLKLASAILLLP